MQHVRASTDPFALTSAEFTALARQGGIGADAALKVYRSVFRTGRSPVDWAAPRLLPVLRRTDEDASGTIKFTQQIDDRLESESVILPQRSAAGRLRHALCVSSQIGCAMGCTFCETAQMGLMRNLTSSQIIAQWHAAAFDVGTPISNIVFMGMGEPLENLDAVMQAVRVLTDHNGPAIASSRITVSTVGRIAAIRRLAELADAPGLRRLRLAVSLNAPNDAIRSEIMPINRAEPIDELLAVLRGWTGRRRARVLIEYVLIPGMNDRTDHADELARRLGDLPCTVNVIPYNPRRNSPWPAPHEEDVQNFARQLIDAGVLVKRRRTLGRSLMAACGQLGNERIRRRVVESKAVRR